MRRKHTLMIALAAILILSAGWRYRSTIWRPLRPTAQRAFAALVLPMVAWSQLPPVPATPVSIIIDTDIGDDIGDADADSVAIRLQQLGYCRILGGITTTPLDYGASMLKLLFFYSGMDNIPIGAWQSGISNTGGVITDHYAQATVTHYATVPVVPRNTFADSVSRYRQLLAPAANGSVTIIAYGFATSLSGLLQSPADAISGQTGVQLVTAKVSKLVMMAGHFPTGLDGWNIIHDVASAQYVAANWPTSIYWAGDEIGNNITAGAGLYAALGPANPLKYAHQQWGSETQLAWDEIAVIYGVLGNNGYFTDSGSGTVAIDGTAHTTWASSPVAGRYYLITARPNSDFATLINSLLVVNTAAANVTGGSAMQGIQAVAGSGAVQ